MARRESMMRAISSSRVSRATSWKARAPVNRAINSRAGSVQGSLSLAAKGAEFSKNDARRAAMQAIGEQLEAQVSQLLKK